MRGLTVFALLALLACAPSPDRGGLQRRALTPAAASGWARLPLDGPAQRAWPELWLSDAEGVAIPFEVEREGLWQPRALDLEHVLLGRDPAGKATAEFTLRFPEGWQVREREHLRVDLDLEGKAPWVCRVEVQRRLEGGAFLSLERDAPLHVFDLGEAGGRRSFYLPWDARTYRLTLAPTQGEGPRLKGIALTACTRPEELRADEVLTPRLEPKGDGPRAVWLLRLEAPERIVGADVVLKPPVAPVLPELRVPAPPRGGSPGSGPDATPALLPVQGLVWNLPALGSRSTRLAWGPIVTDRLELSLPEGARLDEVKLLVRREVLIFPAEAGRAYYLHTGGLVKHAPGSLGALPASSRTVYATDPLKLGAAGADPNGLPRVVPGAERTRPWLPWAAALVVVLLGFYAFRLLGKEA